MDQMRPAPAEFEVFFVRSVESFLFYCDNDGARQIEV
jgi:hypothetical protein